MADYTFEAGKRVYVTGGRKPKRSEDPEAWKEYNRLQRAAHRAQQRAKKGGGAAAPVAVASEGGAVAAPMLVAMAPRLALQEEAVPARKASEAGAVEVRGVIKVAAKPPPPAPKGKATSKKYSFEADEEDISKLPSLTSLLDGLGMGTLAPRPEEGMVSKGGATYFKGFATEAEEVPSEDEGEKKVPIPPKFAKPLEQMDVEILDVKTKSYRQARVGDLITQDELYALEDMAEDMGLLPKGRGK